MPQPQFTPMLLSCHLVTTVGAPKARCRGTLEASQVGHAAAAPMRGWRGQRERHECCIGVARCLLLLLLLDRRLLGLQVLLALRQQVVQLACVLAHSLGEAAVEEGSRSEVLGQKGLQKHVFATHGPSINSSKAEPRAAAIQPC